MASTGTRELAVKKSSPDEVAADAIAHTEEFLWNSRPCRGNALHLAALEGDTRRAEAALARGVLVKTRFSYETEFRGQKQEGSGEAIHLAASRGNVDLVKLLLSKRADLEAQVSRDHKNHYNVLHAALFAEGRGGSKDMIEYLFEEKAELSLNQDGKAPIHIAFQTGNVPVINLVRSLMKTTGVTDQDYEWFEGPSGPKRKVPFPLELGCQGGKMKESELSEAAELTLLSLQIFIKECPQCLPAFLERMQNEKDETLDLGRNIKTENIAKVLREAPEAATALLRYATVEPQMGDKFWHPLPTRVSFAPRGRLARFKRAFNPQDQYLTEYQCENFWSFDEAAWSSPDWHQPWVDRDAGKPIIDAEIRVCLIADLICPEVFAALVDPKNAGSLQLYEDDTIHAMTKHLFWKAAGKIDLTSVALSLWGLALLLGEEAIIRTSTPLDTDEGRRLLKSAGAGTFGGSHQGPAMRSYEQEISDAPWVAYTWIACKALVDLLLEFAEFYGCWKIGRWRDWFTVFNLTRCLLAGLPSILLIEPDCRPVLICAVFLYWMRLLGCFTLMQYIGVELLPIMDLASGLGPSLFVTAIAYGAFTHAFYVVRQSAQALWPSVSTDTFAVLITAALPETAEGVSGAELVLVLIAVLFFTVLIMNVFIGVICDLYNRAKEQAELQFQKRRAESCLLYLLRMQLIPCGLLSHNAALAVAVLAGAIGIGFQVYVFRHHAFNAWVVVPFFLCQLCIAVCSMQSPKDLWVNSVVSGESVKGYLWYCKAKVAEEEDSQRQKVQEQLEMMRKLVEDIEEVTCKKRSS